MNSIRPITFVEAPLLASATIAVAALAVVLLGLAQANAAFRDGAARATLARAEALPRGMERDAALSRALIAVDDALKAAPQDASVHALQSRIYLLQATTATLDEISPALLDAARRSAEQSGRINPGNASATALLALIDMSAGPVGPVAADAVARSYRLPASGDGALWRLEAAVRAWPALAADVRQAAIADACMQAAGDPTFVAGLAQAAAYAPDSGLERCMPTPRAL